VAPVLLIPHRPPWLLLDSVEVDGGVARGRTAVTAGDPRCALGLLPSTLVLEALAQTAAAVLGARRAAAGQRAQDHTGYLVEMRDVRLEGAAAAGTPLELTATHERSLGHLHRFRVQARQAGGLVVEGQMTFAVEVTG